MSSNSNYIKLKIPFATKSYINRKSTKLIIKGIAFYIFDIHKQKYIDEYIQLELANYRITDKALIKPTKHYQKKEVKFFRDNYLDKFSNIDPNILDKTTYKNLNDSEIIKINDYFLNKSFDTVRNMYSYLSGSNPAGAETNNKSTPIPSIDNNFAGINFCNVLKNFENHEKDTNKRLWLRKQDLKIYSLFEFMDSKIINNFEDVFYSYNYDYLYKDNISINITEEQDFVDYEIIHLELFKLKENQETYIDSIINKTIDNFDSLNHDDIKNRLRGFYTSNINWAIKNKWIPVHSTIQKNNLSQIDNAHIIPFSELYKAFDKMKWKEAVNPFNCLRIDKSYHAMFDKHKIGFDINGNLYPTSKPDNKQPYLDIVNMPKQTLEFFKKYLKQKKPA